MTDSSAVAQAAAREIYLNAMGQDLDLYNGVFYKGYTEHENDEGQPYFVSDVVGGPINYDGVFYEDIPMLYDLVEDKVIIEDKSGATRLQLIDERLNAFSLKDHHFVRLTPSTTDNAPESGFYEVLFDGKLKAYAKWHKKKIDVIGATAVQVRFEDQNRFYIFNGKEYIQVKSKASVLEVLKDKKQVLSKFIRKHNIKFGANCGEALPKVLTQYESGS